jgi:hypothetical protein
VSSQPAPDSTTGQQEFEDCRQHDCIGSAALGQRLPATKNEAAVPYATVSQHLNPLASAAAVARDPPRASLVHWITQATVVELSGPVCGRYAQPAPCQPQRR